MTSRPTNRRLAAVSFADMDGYTRGAGRDETATLFERTEAEMGRAMLLLGRRRRAGAEPGEALKETLAPLSALSEVLSEAPAAIPTISSSAAEGVEEARIARG